MTSRYHFLLLIVLHGVVVWSTNTTLTDSTFSTLNNTITTDISSSNFTELPNVTTTTQNPGTITHDVADGTPSTVSPETSLPSTTVSSDSSSTITPTTTVAPATAPTTTVAPATATTTTTVASSTTTVPTNKNTATGKKAPSKITTDATNRNTKAQEQDNSNGGVVTGTVIGVILAVVIVGIGIFVVVRRSRLMRRREGYGLFNNAGSNHDDSDWTFNNPSYGASGSSSLKSKRDHNGYTDI